MIHYIGQTAEADRVPKITILQLYLMVNSYAAYMECLTCSYSLHKLLEIAFNLIV